MVARAPRSRRATMLATGLAIAAIAAWSSPPAGGDELDPAPRAPEVRLASTLPTPDAARQAALSAAPAWLGFQSRHGAWGAWWNTLTGSPHRAVGPAIALDGCGDDSASVDRALRSFVADNPALFFDPALETVAVQRVAGVWYARYRQILNGIPVTLSDWEFRVGTNGRLILFGADAYPAGAAGARPIRVLKSVAREAARREAAPQGTVTQVAGGDRALLLPVVRASGVEFRLVYDFRVRTAEPPATWAVMVDAEDGTIVQRENLTRPLIEGHVTSLVHPLTPVDALQSRDASSLFVAVGSETTATDGLGHYALGASSGTVAARFYGRFCDVTRADGPRASVAIPAPGPGTYDVAWTDANSQAAERDVYYHVNLAHDHIKRVDPGLVRIDRPMPVLVNQIQGECNAYWDDVGLVFFLGGTMCLNTANSPGVIYHEYGHGIEYEVYRQAANDPTAYPHNYTLNEGCAEMNEIFVLDDSLDARGLYLVGEFARSIDLASRWPEDFSNIPYCTMNILTGSFWVLRRDIGLDAAEHLCHFAKYGMPDDLDDGVAMSEYFLETLVADDDDANLSNGTPHLDALLRAFNPRGIGTSYYFTFNHTPLADQAAGLVAFTATIAYAGPLGTLAAGSPAAHVSINDGPYVSLPMIPTATPNQFRTQIQAPAGALVRYYLTAAESFGGIATRPEGAPARRPYAFVVGGPSALFADDMEIDRGWTVGAIGDSATGGIWVRGVPIGVTFFDPVQTGADHTPGAGTRCWITGNNANSASGSNRDDVDGGRTSLTSPLLNATGVDNPIIDYYRWYTNRLVREPETDYWRMLLSNDNGAHWVAVENTTHSENRWERILVRVQSYVTPTAQMRVRFVARDSGGPSTVEAAMDDFRLLGFAPTATQLVRFDASARADAIEIRWQFAARDPGLDVRLERGDHPEGPWSAARAEMETGEDQILAVDRDVEPGRTYYYRLVATESDGTVQRFGPVEATFAARPTVLAIEGIAPNPSSDVARIDYTLPAAGRVIVRVFDPAGREVARLADGPLPAGRHEALWSASERGATTAPGIYFVRVEWAGRTVIRPVVVLH